MKDLRIVTFCKIRKGKKLYGFDNFKDYKFLQIGLKIKLCLIR